jgi:hypothetical protein
VRPCKWIKRTMRQRANGISAMGSLCSYSVCTLTHRAFDPFARPHSDIYSILIQSVFFFNALYRSTKGGRTRRENNKTLPSSHQASSFCRRIGAKNVDSESDIPKANHAFGCYCLCASSLHWLFFTVRVY